MRLRAESDGEHPLSVSLRLADGSTFYSGSDRQAPEGRFNILIVTQPQADAIDEAHDNADVGDGAAKPAELDELRLISPRLKGFAIFRQMALRDGDYRIGGGAAGQIHMQNRAGVAVMAA